MDNRDQKTFFYRRKIVDLEKNYQDKSAGKFIDKKVRDVHNTSIYQSDQSRSDAVFRIIPEETVFGWWSLTCDGHLR